VKAKILTIDPNIPVNPAPLTLQKGYDPFLPLARTRSSKKGPYPFLQQRQAKRLPGLVPKERRGVV